MYVCVYIYIYIYVICDSCRGAKGRKLHADDQPRPQKAGLPVCHQLRQGLATVNKSPRRNTVVTI